MSTMPASGAVRTLAVPTVLLGVLLIWLGLEYGVRTGPLWGGAHAVTPPATVLIEPRAFSYRDGGEFLRAGHPEDAPLVHMSAPPPLEIMKYEVSTAEYSLCVHDGACLPATVPRDATGRAPSTGVSFEDASAYAAWLSAVTSSRWRLPTVAEWAFAAGDQAVDPALLIETEVGNPASRWLAAYEKEALRPAGAREEVPEQGASGTNELGVADIRGPVWEWTSTCHSRTVLDASGAFVSRIESCGVRIVEGRHRTAMSFFIREGRSGGCAIGAPPDHLGFRLVRDG